MTRKTIAILRKLVRAEIKECRNAIRYGNWHREDIAWCKARIVELDWCLDEIKRHVEDKP
jgi:hypothetical protein